MGGYCFFNNAAIAAQAFLDRGAGRVAILDVDYHHGNGTQDIFYDRADVLFTSIHGDPRFEYPYFLGYADEKGNGVGTGYNFNYPLAAGSDWATWSQALQAAIRQIQAYAADVLIVSLGWIPSRRTRFPSSAWTAPTTCAWAKPSASSAWPRCS